MGSPRDRLKDSIAANRPTDLPTSPLPTVDDLTVIDGVSRLQAVDLLAAAQAELLDKPALAVCDPQTIRGAVMLSAEIGLIPGRKGGCFFSARGSHATWHLAYRGLAHLLLTDGGVVDLEVHEIHAGDKFEATYRWGHDQTPGMARPASSVEHTPAVGDAGDVIGAYGVLSDNELAAAQAGVETAEPEATVLDATSIARARLLRKAEPFLPAGPTVRRALAADGHVPVWDTTLAQLALHDPDDFLEDTQS